MSGAASEPSLIYLLACMAGVRKERGRGRGRKLDHETTRSRALKFPLPPPRLTLTTQAIYLPT